MGKKNNKNNKNWILYIILGGFILELIRLIKSKKLNSITKKLKDLETEEINEIKKLKNGKEPFLKFGVNSCKLFKDLFIPHQHNDHKPKILRAKSLLGLALVLLVLKFSLVGYLFFSFPQGAKLSEVITSKIFLLINHDRSSDNLPRLEINPVLSASALAKAEDMLAKDYFAHYTPDGLKPWDFINRDLYPYTLVGENLAINFTTADSAHNALMNSESHKKNILNSNYSEVGIAVVNGMLDNKNTNVLVELFATKGIAKLAVSGVKQETETAVPEVETPKIAVSEDNVATLGEESEAQEVLSKVENNHEPIEEEAQYGNPLTGEIAEKEEVAEDSIITEEEKSLVIAQASPNLELENPNNFQAEKVKNTDQDGIFFTAKVISIFNYVLISILGIFSLALFFNIIIRIKIQHKHVIIQSVIFLVFVSGLIYLKFHYLENVLSYILII
ncbi:hypothetical protein DRH27_03255 [Candidatus Falkowbacteria bacterium]|nr:MAG: hypothetical protein DRH27_03255 [Candidatus Falkowbacteria bacterium]